MTVTVITGATRGLGLETARRLVAAGHTVYLGARDPRRGRAIAEGVGATVLALDVTDETSVRAAAESLRDEIGHLDVLVNNAGIAGSPKPVGDISVDDVHEAFLVNVYGVVRSTHAFLPLLERSAAPVIVNVSSGLGSITRTTDPDRMESGRQFLPYQTSKAALNMLTTQYAKAYPSMRINAADPGYTATDFNGNQGTKTVAEGARIIVELATVGPDGPTGGYFADTGPVPW